MELPKKKVYIETTIPSIITARPSMDITKTYRQGITKFFWENERHKYDLCISEFVLEECSKGDPNAANRRMDLLSGIPFYPRNNEIEALAEEYFEYLNISRKAKTDCFHLAVCVVYKINYLLSWNMTHLGRPAYSKIAVLNGIRNLWLPELVTPDLLLEIEKEEAENELR
ncbi:MAG: type II toxin-antitoxin system VapC family toxin [Fibromonadaceae bacterium]|jgi:predicted nucleic acid-binding protein|nr:type II toxin-antitoxin system VapC family toxin [Fibromonadaceae bacterium]